MKSFVNNSGLNINIFTFGSNFQTSVLSAISLPVAFLALHTPHHNRELALVSSLSAAVSMLIPPVIGFWSDQLRIRGGSRRQFLLAGSLFNALALVAMVFATTPRWLSILYLLSVLGQSAASVTHQALWSDTVPAERRGTVAGYKGLFTLAGTLTGLGLAAWWGALPMLWVMAFIITAVAVWTAVGVTEYPPTSYPQPHATMQPKRRVSMQSSVGTLSAMLRSPFPPFPLHKGILANKLRRPLRGTDFAWVFSAQVFVSFGSTLLMTFVLYFFHDVLHVSSPTQGTAAVAGLALISAVGSSLWIGRISDRSKRRLWVAAAGTPMALAAAAFALWPRPAGLWLFAILYGIGYGAFISTDWALVNDALPNPDRRGYHLGIWGIASVFPAVLAPLFGGWLLSVSHPLMNGYRLLFLTAGASFGAGSLLVLAVRGNPIDKQTTQSDQPSPRLPLSPGWTTPLRLLIAAWIEIYVHLTRRIRRWGTFEKSKGATLVVSNHVHDLDGMVIPPWLILSRPWRKPVYMVASKRMFEPGFLAFRGPTWLAPLLYRLNMGRFFTLLGILPIENQPLRRPLASWAYAIQQQYGDLPIREVFNPSVCSTLPVRENSRLHDLWTGKAAQASQQFVSLPVARAPFVHALQQNIITEIRAQLITAKLVLIHGETVFLTPEGRYTKDGALSKLRQSLQELLPASERLVLIALSYDPYVHVRLALYLRAFAVSLPITPTDLAIHLTAARPITITQVVSSWILEQSGSFNPTQVLSGVKYKLSQLPSNVFWVPELYQPSHPVTACLKRMRRQGILSGSTPYLRLTEHRTHPEFPDVTDYITYQAQWLRETLSAAISQSSVQCTPKSRR